MRPTAPRTPPRSPALAAPAALADSTAPPTRAAAIEATPSTVPTLAAPPLRSTAARRAPLDRRGPPRRRGAFAWELGLGVAVAGVLSVAAAALRPGRAPTAPAAEGAPTAPAAGGAAVAPGVVAVTRAFGTARPRSLTPVGAPVSGRVARVLVGDDSPVRAGDLLAELDAAPYRAQLAQARAALLSARAQLAQGRANLLLAEQNLERARRQREPSPGAADLDAAAATWEAARAGLALLSARAAQAEAAVLSARASLRGTRVLAPASGVVAARAVEAGQLVEAGPLSPPLFLIADDLRRLRVVAALGEAEAARLRPGARAAARPAVLPQLELYGTLRELRAVPGIGGAAVYQAVVEVENPQGRLRPGMRTSLSIAATPPPRGF